MQNLLPAFHAVLTAILAAAVLGAALGWMIAIAERDAMKHTVRFEQRMRQKWKGRAERAGWAEGGECTDHADLEAAPPHAGDPE